MDWKYFLSVFWLVFLAELGDKTQLTVLMQGATHGRWTVVLPACLALVCSTVLAAVAGNWMGRLLPPRVVWTVGGVMFLGFGIWMLVGAARMHG